MGKKNKKRGRPAGKAVDSISLPGAPSPYPSLPDFGSDAVVSNRESKRAARAETYGRSVGSAVPDFEAAAFRGQDSLAAALISRHNQRMERVGRVQPAIVRRSKILVNQLFGISGGLDRLGVDQDRAPNDWGAGWINHLGWGVDSVIGAVRLLLCGQYVGAALIARSQLERWALNLEYNVEASHISGESAAEYYNRLWSCLDSSGFFQRGEDPTTVALSPRKLVIANRQVWPGRLYEDCSEFLHGRGDLSDSLRYEAIELLAPTEDTAPLLTARIVLDVLELCTERLACCVVTALIEAGRPRDAHGLRQVATMTENAGNDSYPRWGFWPLVPSTGLNPAVFQQVEGARWLLDMIRRGERLKNELLNDAQISAMFYMASRGRAIRWALQSFEAEVAMLGDDWDVSGLYSRENDIVFVAESLALVARWDSRPGVVASAAYVSSGLRSAFWLWLEDDDRAMGVLRIVLESCARLEVYGKKPEKAQKLTARATTTTPRDWIDAAGWRRLKALNYALGDLAHTREGSQWAGSRQLLSSLVPPSVPEERAPNQGRGFALTAITAMAARTALSLVGGLSPDLAHALEGLFSSTSLFDNEVEARLNEWLDRAWKERDFDFGDPVFSSGPRAEQRDAGRAGLDPE